MSTPRISICRAYSRNFLNSGEKDERGSHGTSVWSAELALKSPLVLPAPGRPAQAPTIAGHVVLVQLHEMGAGTGQRAIVVDEAEVRTRPFSPIGFTRIRSCKGDKAQ